MELTTRITAQTRVSATLEESGTLSLKVFAESEYAPGRTTTAEVPMSELPQPVQDAVAAALREALEAAAAVLGRRVARAILKSTEVASGFGEI